MRSTVRRPPWPAPLLLLGLAACPPSPAASGGAAEVPIPSASPAADAPAPTDAPPAPTATATASASPSGGPAADLRGIGERCTRHEQCKDSVCEGPGCGEEGGTCQPAVHCRRDRRPYCGCDGVTFHASGNCPRRLFAHEGPCP